MCTCGQAWNSVLPPPPCPVHGPFVGRCCGFGDCRCDDTVPIQLIVCGHTDSPWCPRCAGGIQ